MTVKELPPLPQTRHRLGRWFQPRLRTKITAPYIILALLLAIGATFFVTRQMTTSLQGQFLTFLKDSGQRAADGVVEAERQNLALLRQIAFTSGMAEAAAAGDAEQLQTLVAGNVVNARGDVVEVLDRQGKTLLTMYHLPGGGVQDYRFIRGDSRSNLDFVRSVLAGEADDLGDKFAGLARDLELAPGSALGGRDTVALFSVSLPREAIIQAGSSSAFILVTLNSAGLFAILIVGIGLARSITRPILELVGVSSQVARGDLSAEVKVGSADEIGVLQRAFQRMIEGLRERDLIREIFGRYVDRDVAEQILAGAVDLGGSVKRVTVFFSDIRSFTSISSQLSPAWFS